MRISSAFHFPNTKKDISESVGVPLVTSKEDFYYAFLRRTLWLPIPETFSSFDKANININLFFIDDAIQDTH
ncbi:unnamed protein product, partial [Amoebophrya sp. A25]|eukprot:GSA25T00024160001.1